MRKSILHRTWMVLVFLMTASGSIFGLIGEVEAVETRQAALNQWVEFRMPANPLDRSRIPEMLKRIVPESSTHVAITRFELSPGATYTFQSEYPGDSLPGSVCLVGVNPLAPSKEYSAPSGTTGMVLCHHRSFPGGDIKNFVFGTKENFTVFDRSPHTSAWVVAYSAKPDTPVRFRMLQPAEPEDLIRKSGGYRIAPGKAAQTSWANVFSTKLWLGYAAGEQLGQSPAGAANPPPPASGNSTATPPSAAQPGKPPAGGPASWSGHILSGKPFRVVFDRTADKFDDSVYTGDWRTDPMGTLKGGESYRLVYQNGRFACTGYNQQQRQAITAEEGGARPEDGQVCLWGLVLSFDGTGQVFHPKYGLVGRLALDVPGGQSAAN